MQVSQLSEIIADKPSIKSKRHGRRPTTGKFKTREELINKLVLLVDRMSVSSAARICGISRETAAKLLKSVEVTQ